MLLASNRQQRAALLKQSHSNKMDIAKEVYTKNVIEHAIHPRNRGEMKNPDGKGIGGSPCGDLMEFYIKVGKKKIKGKTVEYLHDVKYETMGCAAAIATASVTSEQAKGKTLEQAKKVTCKKVMKILGGLPHVKHHCCELTNSALQNAIKDWEKKKK